MSNRIPRSPFSTRLSGSAKETELRIRNIVQWKKKRPPVLLVILSALTVLFCCGLVSCQTRQEEVPLDGDITSGDTASDGDLASENTETPQEPTEADPFPSKIRVFFPWESKLWHEPMERLSQEQKDLLANLPVDELPREPVGLGYLFREEIWRDTLIPMAADEENDVTLYGVVSAASVPNVGSRITVISQTLDVDGIVLRYGDQTVYEPLSWGGNAWYGVSPWVSVRDYDGDGKAEAAVCLYSGRGTGIHRENLYYFDLDTLTYTVPDYSSFGEIVAEHDPTAHTLILTAGAESLTVDVAADQEPNLREGWCRDLVQFREEDGRIDCWVWLDFGGAVSACASAPVIWQDGGYRLGEITLSESDSVWWD